jgi:hypothetical protein
VTVTATVVVAEDRGPLEPPVRRHDAFVDSMVERLHAEYGVAPGEIRDHAHEVLATFAGAPVQSFVPILVEKALRGTYRAQPRGVARR